MYTALDSAAPTFPFDQLYLVGRYYLHSLCVEFTCPKMLPCICASIPTLARIQCDVGERARLLPWCWSGCRRC